MSHWALRYFLDSPEKGGKRKKKKETRGTMCGVGVANNRSLAK